MFGWDNFKKGFYYFFFLSGYYGKSVFVGVRIILKNFLIIYLKLN